LPKNPNWKRDEVILALDTYFKYNPAHISKNHEAIKELSDLLNRLPIHDEVDTNENFRNIDGVYMKLCNFLSFDPDYHGKGLDAGSKLDKEIWDEFSGNRQVLTAIANRIRNCFEYNSFDKNISVVAEGESEFWEGKILYRKHRSIERNQALINKAKIIAKRENRLYCEVCGFDFEKFYGELGQGYIECHHKIPVSEYSEEVKVKTSDLSLVCSNCHRMLHIKRPWSTVEQLRGLIKKE